jgi:uncharacterized protein with PQ loop repeat
MQGLIHRHKRIRKNAVAPRAASGFWKGILDRVTMIAGILGPIMVIPQIYQIYSTHMAIGVSALSWGSFALLDLPFICYGILHRDRPIVTTYSLFCFANILVAAGAILYG